MQVIPKNLPGKTFKKNYRGIAYKFAYRYLQCMLYEVRNKAIAPGKSQKINKHRAMFIPNPRVY